MILCFKILLAQVEMEEHLLDVQDGGSRAKGRLSNKDVFGTLKKNKKLQSSRLTTTKKGSKTKTNISFVPTKRPPVRARRPKILNKPVVDNNLGRELIPPESIRSGKNPVVDDYEDYEYIYFYDNYDQRDDDVKSDPKLKSTQTLINENKKKNEQEIELLAIERKKVREEKRIKEKQERDRKLKEEEDFRQEQLRLRQQEQQAAKEQRKEQRRIKEEERRRKLQKDRELQEKRRLELSRRLEEEQNRFRQQQLSALDNSRQNKQFAQRQQNLFRKQSSQGSSFRQGKSKLARPSTQERRKPKFLQEQTPRFQNRPAPVDPPNVNVPSINNILPKQVKSPVNQREKSPEKSPKQSNTKKLNNKFSTQLNPIGNRDKVSRKQKSRARANSGRNRANNFQRAKNRGRHFKQNNVLTTAFTSQVTFTTTTIPQSSTLQSTLPTPIVTKSPRTFSRAQNGKLSRNNNRKRPNNRRRPKTSIPKRQRVPKVAEEEEPRLIPIANVKPPNAKQKEVNFRSNKNSRKGNKSKPGFNRNRNKNSKFV